MVYHVYAIAIGHISTYNILATTVFPRFSPSRRVKGTSAISVKKLPQVSLQS